MLREQFTELLREDGGSPHRDSAGFQTLLSEAELLAETLVALLKESPADRSAGGNAEDLLQALGTNHSQLQVVPSSIPRQLFGPSGAVRRSAAQRI